jgi:signal transduction histidine kinase
LRLKITAWIVAVFAVVLGAMWVVVLVHHQSEFRRAHDARLTEELASAAERLEQTDAASWDGVLLEAAGGVSLAIFPESDLSPGVGASAAGGATLDDEVWARLLASALGNETRLWTNREGPAPLRVGSKRFVSADGTAYRLFAAGVDAAGDRSLASLSRTVLLASLAAVVLVGLAVWFLAGRAVRPLVDLQKMATEMRPEHMPDADELHDGGAETSQLHHELAAAFERIEEGYRAQSRFLTNVSHELKTPISVILAQAQTLPKHHDLPEEVGAFHESVTHEMRRLGRMIESFLLLSRVREGKTRIHDRQYSVNELVMDAVINSADMAEMHEVRISPALAETEHDLMCFGDPYLLQTALDNLVRNAIRFSPSGERVEVTVNEEDEHAIIRVRDHGPGVPEQQLETIFDRFAQADEEQRHGRGSGLGLEIARSIAELHGGSVGARNRHPGAEFMIRLPLVRDGDRAAVEEEE